MDYKFIKHEKDKLIRKNDGAVSQIGSDESYDKIRGLTVFK